MAISTAQIASETDLKGTLINQELSTTGLTAYVSFVDAKTGEARTPQSTTLMFTIDKDNERSETILCTSHSTSSGVTTLTISASGRALPKYGVGSGSGTGNTHSVGAQVGCVNIARPINQLADQAAAKSGETFTGPIDFSGTTNEGLTVSNLTTVQRDALASPSNGLIIYNTTAGEFQVYQGGAWSTLASGSTQPNASTTVAGKVEIATDAELAAGTSTGGTGALLVAPGSSFNSTPAATKVPVANASAELEPGWVGSKTYLYIAAGEAVDGSTTPQLVFVSDGTNSKTAGRFYKADADDTTNVAFPAVGFITENASSVGTSYYVKRGIITGFTGLTAGALYYPSTTAGSITTTQPLLCPPIARAISTTAICTYTDMLPTGYAKTYTTVGVGASTNVDIYTGYKPRTIQFNLYMTVLGTTAAKGCYSGVYDVVNNVWSGWETFYTGTVTVAAVQGISAISDFVVSSSGAASASITMTITVNSNYTRFTFTNATLSGGGGISQFDLGVVLLP